MKRLLILAESLRINETSSGIVSSTFIEKLTNLGFEITTMYPNNLRYEISWLSKCDKIPIVFNPNEKKWYSNIPKIRAIPTYFNLGFSPSFKQLIDAWKKKIIIETSNKKYDKIIVLGSGAEFSPHFAISQLKLEIPVYISMHDPYPMHYYPYPYKIKKSLISWLNELKFTKVLDKANKVIFPSKKLYEYLSKFFPQINNKSIIIPHIPLNLKNLPANENDSMINLNFSKINIIHLGSLLGPRNPKFLLESINELINEYPILMNDVKFTFIGKIAKENKRYIMNSENIEFIDLRISYKKSLEIIEHSAGIFVIEAISDFSPFMPGKLADIFLKKKPILALCPKNSEVISLIGNTRYHSELNQKTKIKTIIKQFVLDCKNNDLENKSEHCYSKISSLINLRLIKLFNS